MNRKKLTSWTIYSFILISVVLFAYSIMGIYAKDVSLTGLFFSSQDLNDKNYVDSIAKDVIPGDDLNIRPYTYNDQEISFSYYSTPEGFNFISYEIDCHFSDKPNEYASHYCEQLNIYPTEILTEEEQKLVDSVAPNVFRPCCGVPASTPDCSHGFAARGLIKLLAKEGWTEEQIYNEISIWNRFWWPKHYVGVALYMDQQDKSWRDLTSKELLSKDYSTSSASRKISSTLGISLY